MRSLLVLVLTITAACGASEVPAKLDAASLRIDGAGERTELSVEVADTDDERATGLMGREELEPYEGMAFVWPEPTTARFWMKDTLIPLSIAFWDERGRIVAILDMEPCVTEDCPRYDSGHTYVGAVEVEQGLFEQRGIELGDRVELEGRSLDG